MNEWNSFALYFIAYHLLFQYVQEPTVHLLFCVRETYQKIVAKEL